VVVLIPLASVQTSSGMAFPQFLRKHYTAMTLWSLPRLCEQNKPGEGEGFTKVDISHEVVVVYELYFHILRCVHDVLLIKTVGQILASSYSIDHSRTSTADTVLVV
jgi:hypothetical protein